MSDSILKYVTWDSTTGWKGGCQLDNYSSTIDRNECSPVEGTPENWTEKFKTVNVALQRHMYCFSFVVAWLMIWLLHNQFAVVMVPLYPGNTTSKILKWTLVHLPSTLFTFAVILKFRSQHGRLPQTTNNTEEQEQLLTLRDEIMKEVNLDVTLLPDEFAR